MIAGLGEEGTEFVRAPAVRVEFRPLFAKSRNHFNKDGPRPALRGAVSGCGWQLDADRRSGAESALNVDGATVGRDDVVGDRQAQAGARRARALDEALKHPREDLRRDAFPG